ncbi:MAG: DMT family transporter [Clostridiales bacterium]|nr:DMT family transporter [Clostridiales bacterium]MCI7702768.1 DMT family transporter [Clostridiales bacterium]
MTRKEWIADGILTLTALIWGTGFVVMKNTLSSVPPAAIIAIRYGIATLLAAVLFRRHLKGIARADVARGALVGLLLALAYIVQTIGLDYTTAGKNAFLTTVYVLLVPFASWLIFRQKLSRSNFIAAGLMLAGIGCLSLDGESGGLNIGDLLTLLCGVFYAAHIMAVERCQRKTNTYALIVLQFAFAAAFAAVYHLLFERGLPMSLHMDTVGSLLYLSVFSTTVAMSLQNIGQSMAPASHASILLSLESVFGALASCIFLGEAVTPRMLLGFAVIFAALVVNSQREKA